MGTRDDIKPCRACDGTGEVYRKDPTLPDAHHYDGTPWQECEECGGFQIAIDPHSMRHYWALVTEAARVGWPESFRQDLTVHDRHACEEHGPSVPFLWILRDGGTYLWHLDKEATARRGEADTIAILLRSQARENDGRRFYLWDGVGLQCVEVEALIDHVYEACTVARRAAARAA